MSLLSMDELNQPGQVRGMLSDKRVLMVLDNANTGAQVEPLLPPADSRCAVLITTRNDLASTDGWPSYELKSFSAQSNESLQLFERLLGSTRVKRHHLALKKMAELLGHLPLALAIVGSILAIAFRSPSSNKEEEVIEELLHDLQQENKRLSLLTRDHYSVRASFNLSFNKLPIPLQQYFVSLGLIGGVDFSSELVAHMWQLTSEVSQSNLDYLISCSFVQRNHVSRYQLHPLLRDYAREHLVQQKTSENTLTLRYIEYFQNYVMQNANDHIALDTEIDNIMYVLNRARELRFDGQYVAIVHTLRGFLESRGLYTQASDLYSWSISLAKTLKNNKLLSETSLDLATILVRQAEYDQAIVLCEDAMLAANLIKDTESQLLILDVLRTAHFGQGNRRKVEEYSRRGLILARRINNKPQISKSLVNLGMTLKSLGNFKESEAMLLEGKEVAIEIGDFISVNNVYLNLGEFYREQGQIDKSIQSYAEALVLARQSSDGERICNLLIILGELYSAYGLYEQAGGVLTEAVEIAKQIQIPKIQSVAETAYSHHLLRLNKNSEAAEHNGTTYNLTDKM